MKVVILGNSGSGKSTLARRLAEAADLPVLDLDTVVWEPGQVAVPRGPQQAATDLQAFCKANPSWVVEGCYGSLAKAALAYRPHLLFLDPGKEQCLAHCRARPWEPHKYGSAEQQEEKLEFLLTWVAAYDSRDDDMSRSAHEVVYEAYDGPKQWLREVPGADFRLVEA